MQKVVVVYRAGLVRNGADPLMVERERERLEQARRWAQSLYVYGDWTEQQCQPERQRIADRLAALTPPETTELVQAALTLKISGDVWPSATLQERGDMLRAIFSGVLVEVVEGRIVEWHPKPAFALWVQSHCSSDTA